LAKAFTFAFCALINLTPVYLSKEVTFSTAGSSMARRQLQDHQTIPLYREDVL